MAITTDLERFRLELGDLDTAALLFTDPQAEYFIAAHPTSVLLAVAAAADSLAARFARDFDIGEDGQTMKRSQKSATYLALAKSLRARAATEVAAAEDEAGMPTGRVPARVPTTRLERY